MKQIDETKVVENFSFNNLIQSDCVSILRKMIELRGCFTVFYITDNEQKIIYWEEGIDNISGISRGDVIGKACIDDLIIPEFPDDEETQITLTRSDGNQIELKKYTLVLHKENGDFSGGVGFLQVNKDFIEGHNFDNKGAEAHLNFHGILSRSPTMQPVFQLIQNAAATEVTVLVRGESGSGKELVAKAIHDLSPRSNASFMAINCAALSSNLLESELFGHVRGAFTGAVRDHKGLFERADGGTLFLDEVAELPLDLQAKLLRVVQERNYIPVGGDHAIDVDVRIVAATHRSLREEVKKGRFREDLMYRLRVVPIFIPALRDRREDINLLLWHFIRQHNIDKFRRIETIEPQAMRILMDYQWPGNIRELQNVVEYALVVGQGSNISLSDLPPEFRETHTVIKNTLEKQILTDEEEADEIRKALLQSQGRVTSAAKIMGMSRATFWRKRKLYEI